MTVLQHLSAIRLTLDDGERLLVLPSHPKYAITDFGKVFSLFNRPRRVVGYRRPGRYTEYKIAGKQRKNHHLVLECFGEWPCPDGMECMHLDGDATNNHIDNLKWGTRSKNMKDRHKHGFSTAGELNGASKLTDAEALEIKDLLQFTRTTHAKIGDMYGVSGATISNIATGRKWKHIAGTEGE